MFTFKPENTTEGHRNKLKEWNFPNCAGLTNPITMTIKAMQLCSDVCPTH